jgi:hypothetical protein
VRLNTNVTIIKNKDYNEVAKRDSFKISATNAEDLHYNKRGTTPTASKSAFQCASPIHNPTITHGEIVETVEPINLFKENAHFTTVLNENNLNENSDDAIILGKNRALDRDPIYLDLPEIDGERAETVTAKMDDHHSKKRKFLSGIVSEYTLETPERMIFSPGTIFTQLPTSSEEFFRFHCPTTPGHKTPFYKHRINAVIHGGRVFFPGTPPRTNSGRTRGISVTSLPDKNTPVHNDATNGPIPHSTKLVQCPNMIPLSKLPLISTSTTTFPITMLT